MIATSLLHAMFSIGGNRPERAAAAILDVASRDGDNGAYYDERKAVSPDPLASDPDVQIRLHALTLRMLGSHLAPSLAVPG